MTNLQDIFKRRNSGELSDSQAYKEYLNAGGEEGFKGWLRNAVENGWIDKGFDTVSNVLNNRFTDQQEGFNPSDTVECPLGSSMDDLGNCVSDLVADEGLSGGAKVGIAIGVIAVIGGIFYAVKNKK